MELPKDIKDEIWNYCHANNITSVDSFILKMVKQGFTSEKYGSIPWDKPPEIKEKIIEKEVIKEIIKEVPVEVIKEVEKIIEKEVFITDEEANQKLKEVILDLENKIINLKLELNNKIESEVELNNKLNLSNEEITKLTNEINLLKIQNSKPKNDVKDIYGE
jgi:hypothetical protein